MARGVVVVRKQTAWKETAYLLSPQQREAHNKKAREIYESLGGKPIGAYWRHGPSGRMGVWVHSFPSLEKWEECYARVWSAVQAPDALQSLRYWDCEFEVWYERED